MITPTSVSPQENFYAYRQEMKTKVYSDHRKQIIKSFREMLNRDINVLPRIYENLFVGLFDHDLLNHGDGGPSDSEYIARAVVNNVNLSPVEMECLGYLYNNCFNKFFDLTRQFLENFPDFNKALVVPLLVESLLEDSAILSREKYNYTSKLLDEVSMDRHGEAEYAHIVQLKNRLLELK